MSRQDGSFAGANESFVNAVVLLLFDILLEACGDRENGTMNSRCVKAYADGIDVLTRLGLTRNLNRPSGNHRLVSIVWDNVYARRGMPGSLEFMFP